MPTSLSPEEKKLANSLGISYEQAAQDIARASEIGDNRSQGRCHESDLSHRVRAEETGLHFPRPRSWDNHYNN